MRAARGHCRCGSPPLGLALWLALALVLCFAGSASAFRPGSVATAGSLRLQAAAAGARGADLSSPSAARKELFFEIVNSGLAERFEASALERIYQFCATTRGLEPLPAAVTANTNQHDPCEEYVPGLTAKPWWDASSPDFQAWLPALVEATPIIRRELEAAAASANNGDDALFRGDSNFQKTMGTGWTAIRLQRLGEWNQENTARFPLTTRLLQGFSIPLAMRGVMFARQAPQTGVAAHSDGRNFILTAHLGLSVPQGCTITVGGDTRSWQQDGAIVFDTSFTHSTDNPTDQERFVLILDFWHPELTATERDALAFVYDARNKFESGRAQEIDCAWVRDKKPLTTKEYLDSKRGLGQRVADFFSDGGLVKYR